MSGVAYGPWNRSLATVSVIKKRATKRILKVRQLVKRKPPACAADARYVAISEAAPKTTSRLPIDRAKWDAVNYLTTRNSDLVAESAAHCVLYNPWLLEAILVRIPRDSRLFRLMRINTTFRIVMTTSPTIVVRLYLAPVRHPIADPEFLVVYANPYLEADHLPLRITREEPFQNALGPKVGFGFWYTVS